MRLYSGIEFVPSGNSYEVIYKVEGSELASGQQKKIGELHAFANGHWYFQPAAVHQFSGDDLREISDAVESLNRDGALPSPTT
jgi:hypothetical protein